MGNSKPKSFTYSIPLQNSEEPGYSPIYCNKQMYFTSECSTFLEVFLQISHKYPNNHFLAHLKPEGVKIWTYLKARQKLQKFIKFLSGIPLAKSESGLTLIGILLKSSPKWIIFELACMSLSITTVGLHVHRSHEETLETMNNLKLKNLVCSSEQSSSFLEHKKNGMLVDLENLLVFGRLSAKEKKQKISNFSVIQVKLLEDLEVCIKFPEVDSVYCLNFTSGTTGRPKTVKVTHKNLMAVVIGVGNNGYGLNKDDVYLSYIPLSIPMERTILYAVSKNLSKIFIGTGDVSLLTSELKLVKPTVFFAVPSLLEEFYKALTKEFNKQTGFSHKILKKAVKSKLKSLESFGKLSHSVYDKLVFKKIRETFGGKVKYIVTGVSCIIPDICKIIKVCLSCDIVQGYGVVEANTCNLGSLIGDQDSYHQGGPMCSLEARIRLFQDIASYYPGPVGELCLRGELVCSHYFDGTEVCDSQGWYRTGDVFTVIPKKNAFQFVDRIENLIEVRGAKIGVEKLEAIFRSSLFVSQIFVDVWKDGIIAVIFPNESFVAGLFQGQEKYLEGISTEGFNRKVLEDLKCVANRYGLDERFEVRRIVIEKDQWTEEYLTVTLKIKRNDLRKKYKEIIDNFD